MHRSIPAALGAALLLLGGSAGADALREVGPIGVYGYPEYYVDQDGVALAHCVDPDDARCGIVDPLPNPAQEPNVATGNFWGESFYYLAEATMPTGAGEALLVMAVEGVWDNANEAVIPGDQLVFSRIRLRIDTQTAGTYRVIHPYGTDEFTVGAGRRAINFTADCLHTTPITCSVATGDQFSTPLDPTISRISHFLHQQGAPAGYVGDPTVGERPVSGSPVGQNRFRVEGPDIGGQGVNAIETTGFVVMGKLAQVAPPPPPAPVCGNGTQETGEECDDGNTQSGDGCSSTCQLEAPPPPPDPVCGNGVQETGEECDDGNSRNGDGCSSTCQVEPPPPAGTVKISKASWSRKREQLSVSGSVTPADTGARLFFGTTDAGRAACTGAFVASLTPNSRGSVSYKSASGAFPVKPGEVCIETDAGVAASRNVK